MLAVVRCVPELSTSRSSKSLILSRFLRCVNHVGLDRTIQYAAASRLFLGVSGILGRPVKPYGMHTSRRASIDEVENASLFNVGGYALRPALPTSMVI